MAAEVLFVPKWSISPAGCRLIPAVRTALDELRSRFDVQIFQWPTVVGGPQPPGETWGDAVSVLAECFAEGQHIVAMAPSPVALCMMALDGRDDPASFVAPGIVYPTATMRSFGVDTLADAIEAQGRFSSNFPWVRESMDGAHEDEQHSFSEQLDADIDWRAESKLVESFRTIDLSKQTPDISVPVLYLDLPYFEYQEYPVRASFLGLVPQAECGRLTTWPLRMHLDEPGHEFAATVTGFIDRVEAGTL
ncbi:MAG TPA: hypothetical protein VFO84_05470 [Dehalococcoidia bacterium]|nr:hypothetical protein [Dehalococcoidia bacterium]